MLTIIGFALFVILAIVLAACELFWPFTIGAIAFGIAIATDSLTKTVTLPSAWWLLGYFGVAFPWLFFRWTRFVENKLRAAMRERDSRYRDDSPPRWTNEWDHFVGPFFWWPFDMAAYIVTDLMADAWRWVATIVSDAFDRYAQWRYRKAGLLKEKRDEQNN